MEAVFGSRGTFTLLGVLQDSLDLPRALSPGVLSPGSIVQMPPTSYLLIADGLFTFFCAALDVRMRSAYVQAFRDDYQTSGPILHPRVAFVVFLEYLTLVLILMMQRAHMLMKVSLESGAIYCAAVIGVVISGTLSSPSSPNSWRVPPAFRAATLIIARVGLTQQVDCNACKGMDMNLRGTSLQRTRNTYVRQLARSGNLLRNIGAESQLILLVAVTMEIHRLG
ncbi:hypothetical protein C8R44DRAFT_725096 [Mycena epipterygia]|nr:hypothetical protein C8R44DRAFT_725096 [Mycena epipterygia]